MIKKQKNDDTMEEGWVLCSGCNKWQHQICALFNHRRHDQSPSRNYFCPRCLLHELKHALEGGYRIPQPRMKRAADLDQVRTAFCDRCVRERVFVSWSDRDEQVPGGPYPPRRQRVHEGRGAYHANNCGQGGGGAAHDAACTGDEVGLSLQPDLPRNVLGCRVVG